MKDQTNISIPTAEELRLYLAGKLDAHRANELEQLALDNPLVAEAMEGFELVPAFDALPPRQRFVKNSGTPGWHFLGWGGGLLIGAAAAFWLVPYLTETKKEIPVIVTEQKLPVNRPVDSIVIYSYENDALCDTFHTVMSQSPKVVVPITSADSSESRRFTPEEMQRRNYVMLEKEMMYRDELLGINAYKKYGDRIFHIRDYKVANYSGRRRNDWPPLNTDHVPPNLENHDANADPYTEPVKGIAYLDFMNQCVDAFQLGQYDLALEYFTLILQQYPDDVNAQFYGGLCRFHRGDFSGALSSFEQASSNVSGVFTEEGEFYQAVCLLELGRTDEGTRKLQKIRDAHGFYGDRAASYLEDVAK